MRSWPIALLLLAITGCGSSKPAAVDDPWSVAEYVAAGCPDPGHSWTGAEVHRCAEALSLNRVDRGHQPVLPRRDGPRSGPIFARLVEPGPAGDDDHGDRKTALGGLLIVYRGLARERVPDRLGLITAYLRELGRYDAGTWATQARLRAQFKDVKDADGFLLGLDGDADGIRERVGQGLDDAFELLAEPGPAALDRALVDQIAALLQIEGPHLDEAVRRKAEAALADARRALPAP